MSAPILTTKLYIPPLHPEVVLRPRLIERLNEGLHRKLTLISAPAGFGKTTLVSRWIADCEHPVAWLSLGADDNDLARFLTYLVAALQTISADLGERALGLLQSPQPPPTESVLTGLLNDIIAMPGSFALVLDDYHLIDAKPVDDALTFLLDHLPPQMHLVIATREDPPLPLARLRARGQLTELRAADLRFTLEEAAAFFTQMMGLNLSADDVAALETRTEGWIAGLQLAALSIQGREDVHGFVTAFAGDNRYVVDYLIEEVLLGQPEHVRRFLLQTAILEGLSGPLCDAVTDQEGSAALLEDLERGNLFLVPLDDKRQWYRYHHLFADVLRAHLLEEQPDYVASLHLRASTWYEDNGWEGDAFRHALTAEDYQRAAGLAERAWSSMDRNLQSAAWLGWVKALPDDVVRPMPVLSVGYAWALLDSGALEAADSRLREVESLLETTPPAELIVVDEDEFRVLPATIASARAYHALALGDVPGTVSHARRALDLLPQDDYLRRGIPASLLGLATWTGGDLDAAYQSFAEALTSFQMAGNLLFAIVGVYILADIRLAQGRLRDAIRIYEQALELAAGQGDPPMRGTADLHLGLSELHREQGNLEAATQHLLKSEELGEHAAFPRWNYHRCLVQARIKQTQGDLDGALDLLDEAERLYVRGPVPDIRPIAALKAWVWAAQGRLTDALAWAREQSLSVDDDLSYVREFEHLTLARVLIAQDQHEEVLELIERLLQAAEDGGRTGSVIDILVLQTLAHDAHGDTTKALASLERALTLAEAEGYVRVFIDAGMAHLLAEAASRGMMPIYTSKLLAAFEAESPHPAASQPLIEPLSERELEVLRLVALGLSNREISERLFLALSTVKGHNRNIFDKLQVQRRTEAIARARELGLL